MKAVRFHEHGGPEVLRYEDAPDPKRGEGDVLVEVKAASVNHLDVWLRKGLPGVPISLPRIPGADAAGVVREAGSGVKGLNPGARVVLSPQTSCGLCFHCSEGEPSLCADYVLWGEHVDGCYAGLISVPARCVLPLPDDIPFETAAAAPLVYLTAWRMLVTRGRLSPGETVLIHAVGAGVGTACLQIAKLAGARVIATASTDAKLDKAKALGADAVVNYSKEDWTRSVRRLAGRGGVDLVVDYVGKQTWAGSLKVLRGGGRLVTCGATTGYDPAEDLRHIFFRQLSILGCTMGSERDFHEVMRCVFQGSLKPVVDSVLPLKDAAEAHRRIESRRVFGKLVLVP